MYYQFDSRLNMPAILFDDDRIVVAGKEYDYAELKDIEITRVPLLATYGIVELTLEDRTVPVPFAKSDLHRLRTAVQEAKHIISTLQKTKDSAALQEPPCPVQESHAGNPTQNQVDRSADQPDPYEEMKKLKELLDLVFITQEEFDRKKKELLGL